MADALDRAAELTLSGRIVDEAERIGRFEQVVPEAAFDAERRATAATLASKPPLARAESPRMLDLSLGGEL